MRMLGILSGVLTAFLLAAFCRWLWRCGKRWADDDWFRL